MEKKGMAQELCTVLCAKSISFNSKYHNSTRLYVKKKERMDLQQSTKNNYKILNSEEMQWHFKEIHGKH